MARGQIDPLTGLRGIAAVYVVIFHYSSGPLSRMSNPALAFLLHGYLSVDLFFILSGFVMALNYGHLFRGGVSVSAYMLFLGRRIARIYPLYFVTAICAFLLVLAGWLEGAHARALDNILVENLLMVQTWGFGGSLDRPAWSISTEWAAYLVFPWLLPGVFGKKWMAATCLTLCVASLVVLCGLPAQVLHRSPEAILGVSTFYYGFPLLRCIPEFCLGMLAYRLFLSRRGKELGAQAWPVLALCATCFVLLAIPRTDLALVLILPVLLVAVATGDHLPQEFLSSRTVMLLGTLSYSIYLVHMLLTGLLATIHRQANLHGLAHGQSYGAVVCILLTAPLSWLAYTFVEVPGRKWLRNAFEGSTHRRVESLAGAERGMP